MYRKERQLFNIDFTGLDQGKDERKLLPGALTRANNVEWEKTGRLNKRRGYRIVPTTLTIAGVSIAASRSFQRLGIRAGELVIFSLDTLYAMADPDGRLDGASLVGKGKTIKGAITTYEVTRSSMNDAVALGGGA